MNEQIMLLIQTVGFPIFVALWFMFRFEKRVNDLRHAINNLEKAIIELRAKLES